MRSLGLVALVVTLFAANLAVAQMNPAPCGNTVRIEGVISEIDAGAMQIVVDDQVVQVTNTTVIKKNGRTFAFEDLQVGMTVACCGIMDGDVLVANRINVKYCGR